MDEYEHFPFCEKVNTDSALGGRIPRSQCPCCGGHSGIRRAKRRFNRHATEEPAPAKNYGYYAGETKGKKGRKAKDGWDRQKRTIQD